jgi:hypothetical protein
VSLSNKGVIRQIKIRVVSMKIIPRRSLIEKNGWKGILLKFELTPKGLLEPVW